MRAALGGDTCHAKCHCLVLSLRPPRVHWDVDDGRGYSHEWFLVRSQRMKRRCLQHACPWESISGVARQNQCWCRELSWPRVLP